MNYIFFLDYNKLLEGTEQMCAGKWLNCAEFSMLYHVSLFSLFSIDIFLGSFKPRPFLSYSHSQLVSMETPPKPQPPSQEKSTSTLAQTLDHHFQRLEYFPPLNTVMGVIFQKKYHSPTALSWIFHQRKWTFILLKYLEQLLTIQSISVLSTTWTS